jgi:TATA-binding protein-associated factor
MPGLLGDRTAFRKASAAVVLRARLPTATDADHAAAAAALHRLHRLCLPFMLRRTKATVLPELPPKVVQDVLCDLAPAQRALYDAFLLATGTTWDTLLARRPDLVGSGGERAARVAAADGAGTRGDNSGVDGVAAPAAAPHALACIQYLREICDHPALVPAAVRAALGRNAGASGLCVAADESLDDFDDDDTDDSGNDAQPAARQGPAASRGAGDRSAAPPRMGDSCKLLALRELMLECGLDSGDSATGGRHEHAGAVSSAVAAGGAAPGKGRGKAGTAASGDGSRGSAASVPLDAAGAPRLPLSAGTGQGLGHKLLVFSQMARMLDIVESALLRPQFPRVRYARLDGATPVGSRHATATAFNADPDVRVLLLTTAVGGLGLNLTSADTVVFLDHDWNPQKDLQAMDRVHRLGQTRGVSVYRLLARNTLEERIMGLQRLKLHMADAVLTGGAAAATAAAAGAAGGGNKSGSSGGAAGRAAPGVATPAAGVAAAANVWSSLLHLAGPGSGDGGQGATATRSVGANEAEDGHGNAAEEYDQLDLQSFLAMLGREK